MKRTSAGAKTATKQVLKRVLRCIGPYWIFLALSLALAAASVGTQLLVPILTGEAIDVMLGAGRVDFAALVRIVAVIAISIAVTALSQWGMNECNNRMAFCVSRDLRNMAIQKIQALPLRYLDAHPTGDLVSRVIADVDVFSDGLLMGFTQLFSGVLTIVGTLGFMLYINVPITLVVVVITPLSIVTAAFIAHKSEKHFRRQSEVRGEQTALINEMIEGQKVVQAFQQEDNCLDRFDEINGRLQAASLKAVFYSSLTNPVTRFVNAMVYAGVALVGALFAVQGGITVGQLSSFLGYANQYTKPFNEISGVVTELQNALTCAGRLFQMLDELEEDPDGADAYALPAQEVTGAVELAHVDFRYDPSRPLIEDLNISVRPGQHVAIVGPTGCGKTTLINLLMRFYEIDGGRITLDGVDTSRMDRGELRQQFGMVLQDAWLFDGTIAENIAYGCPEATREEIVAAARAAQVDFFVRTMPQGYDTRVANDAESISQGQRQLLTIARVLLNNPAILILDEATSSVDTRTELAIGRAMDALMRGRTSFVIAHRLSTIVDADLILVMKEGDIVEAGTHDSLMADNGFYASLYNSQFEDCE